MKEKDCQKNNNSTTPPDKWLYEYAIIRYVPRVDRGEFINIGLLMMNKRQKWLKGMISLDEIKLRAINPILDIESLKNQCHIFEKNDVPDANLPVEEKYRWLTAVKSAVLQVSPSHPGIVNHIPTEIENDSETMEREFFRLFTDLVL